MSMVPPCELVWDVGCDHGYVPIRLIQQGVCSRAVASDVRDGPLSRARENIKNLGLEDKITAVISDGLSAGVEGANTLIIAGMGGELTIDILRRGRERAAAIDWILLQPQSHLEDVRRYIESERYLIVDEDMILEDGKYYPMMLIKKSGAAGGSKKVIPLYGLTLEEIYGTSFGGAGCDPGEDKALGEGKEPVDGSDLGAEPDTDNDTDDPQDEEKLAAIYRYGGLLIKKSHPILNAFLLKEEEKEREILNSLSPSTLKNRERIKYLTQSFRLRRVILEMNN